MEIKPTKKPMTYKELMYRLAHCSDCDCEHEKSNLDCLCVCHWWNEMRHLSFLCRIQQGQEHNPCGGPCDCHPENPQSCQCECHGAMGVK